MELEEGWIESGRVLTDWNATAAGPPVAAAKQRMLAGLELPGFAEFLPRKPKVDNPKKRELTALKKRYILPHIPVALFTGPVGSC